VTNDFNPTTSAAFTYSINKANQATLDHHRSELATYGAGGRDDHHQRWLGYRRPASAPAARACSIVSGRATSYRARHLLDPATKPVTRLQPTRPAFTYRSTRPIQRRTITLQLGDYARRRDDHHQRWLGTGACRQRRQ
jgi:hypothetical protein